MALDRKRFLIGSAAAGGTAFAVTRSIPGVREAAAIAQSPPRVEDWVPTTCWIGKQDCGLLARRIDGRVVKLEGHPAHPRNLGTLCPKGVAQIISLYDPNRVKAPLVRTNGKGQPGTWREVSWDRALSLVAAKIKETRAKDPKLVLWQKGRSKAKGAYDHAFVGALGASKLGHGAYCSDAGYRAAEYTIGLHGVLHPDFRHTRYLLSWGWNITNGGGNKTCWLTWNQELVEAKKRGLKVVQIDPRLRGAGPHVDDWLPIKPATDLALALALANVLVQRGYLDRPYLKRYTNAPFLVRKNGEFLRRNGKEQVWDAASKGAKPFDEKAEKLALEGEYAVGGERVRTAFQVFREHIAQYTPKWAAEVTGLPAEKIRELAEQLGENAMIGSTIEVDGLTLPYRPVSIMAYHMAQQELGFQAIRAMLQVFMLLGAVGAVGGPTTDFKWKVHGNYEKLDQVEIKDPPYDFLLKDSKFFPINTGNPGVHATAASDPAKYGVEKIPETVILHMANPLASFADQKMLAGLYEKYKFLVVISPWLSETADHYADVILPAATLEKFEGPLSVGTSYADAVALRVPPMEPLFQSRGEIDIYLDLAQKVGVLYGEEGYLARLNEELKLVEVDKETGEITKRTRYALPLNRKPKVREIFDRWAKAQGVKEGVAYFEKQGVLVKGPISAADRYGYGTDPPFGGARHRLYGESLLRYRNEMKGKGADEIYWRDYTPLPTWRPPTMDASPSGYDLYLISYKLIEYKQSRATFVPLLAELAPKQRLDINPATAKARRISDGDEVWVESHNAVTGETRKLKVQARHTEAIRPDTVGMPHHFGLWTHPWSKGRGPTPNEIFYTGEGYVTNTADQSFQVKVRVYKA